MRMLNRYVRSLEERKRQSEYQQYRRYRLQTRHHEASFGVKRQVALGKPERKHEEQCSPNDARCQSDPLPLERVVINAHPEKHQHRRQKRDDVDN